MIVDKFKKEHHNVKLEKMQYNTYIMTNREYCLYYGMGILLFLIIGILFYNKIYIGIMLTPLSYIFVKKQKEELLKNKKMELNIQFKDAIYSMSSALNVGYSVEQSFREVLKDLKLIYFNPDTPILIEFEAMIRQIEMNIPVERVLLEFANRSGVEDIMNFVDVFITCKRTGGDILKIIKNTSKIIAEKIEIKRELQILIASKKFEHKIMSIIPFAIIFYMWLTSPGFLDVMYSTTMGFVIMTVCLIAYYFIFLLGKKIMSINL